MEATNSLFLMLQVSTGGLAHRNQFLRAGGQIALTRSRCFDRTMRVPGVLLDSRPSGIVRAHIKIPGQQRQAPSGWQRARLGRVSTGVRPHGAPGQRQSVRTGPIRTAQLAPQHRRDMVGPLLNRLKIIKNLSDSGSSPNGRSSNVVQPMLGASRASPRKGIADMALLKGRRTHSARQSRERQRRRGIPSRVQAPDCRRNRRAQSSVSIG